MKLKYCLLIVCMAFLFAEHASAQAIIGANKTPKDYAILELDGTGGGLRLPVLTSAERDGLVLDAEAPGLAIYNSTEGCFQFWNGSYWVSMKYTGTPDNAANGINGGAAFKLGGDLIANTSIAQSGNNLFFDAATGTFSVQNTTFAVNSGGVGIGTSTPSATLDIVAATPNTGFRYNTVGQPTDLTDLILATDGSGNASWTNIAPSPVLLSGVMNPVVISGLTGSGEVPVLISNPLTLTKGIYLITARYVGISTVASTTSYGYNSFIRLRKTGDAADIATVAQVCQLGTTVTGNLNQTLTTPQLIYLLNVPVDGSYEIWGDLRAGTSAASNPTVTVNLTNTIYGNSYFNAIRLTN